MGDYVTKTNVLSALARFKENTDALYETKADANDMKSEIDQHDSRLQNLEQKAGDYSIVQYRGTNAVPTGKAKYGLVKKIVGKSRAWKQLLDNNRITSLPIGTTSLGRVNYRSGHKYLAIQKGTTVGYMQTDSEWPVAIAYSVSSGALTGAIGTAQSSFISGAFFNNTGSQTQNGDFYFCIYDLTLIFGPGNEPTTVADALAQLSALGQYNAYDDGSLVDTTYSAVKTTSININDEIYEIGSIDANGQNDDSVTTASRNKNYIPVTPNTQYFINSDRWQSFKTYSATFAFLSVGSYTQETGGYRLNIGEGVHYIRFVFQGTTPTDIQICLNSYADKTVYHPHVLDTLSLPEPVTLRSAGSVADELDVESGVVTRNVGVVDLSTLTWTESSGVYSATVTGMKSDGQVLSDKYIFTVSGATISVSASTSPTGNLCYELATPTTESIDPVPDNSILTEGGGTIDTIQTQTPVIDNCLDVGYLAI